MRGFLDDRLGWPSAFRRWLQDAVPPVHPGFFPAVLALLALQAGTGLALSFFYAPTPGDAWASVLWTGQHMPALGFVRSVHRFGVSALVVTLCLQILETVLARRYRPPREIAYWVSIALLLVVLAYAMTGNPLPWDQRGFWQSQVEAGIMARVPVVGPLVRQAFQGGNAFGATTLPRLYTLHVLLLPPITLGLLLVRRAAGRAHPPALAPAGTTQRSSQLVLDLAVGMAAVVLTLLWASRLPAPLEAPADPSGTYLARPEWYFLPLNQLLSFFPGASEPVGSAVVPGLLVLVLAALPFLDRGPRGRLAAGAAFAFPAAVVLLLLSFGLVREKGDPALAKAEVTARRHADRALQLAAVGIPPGGPLLMMHTDPLYVGERVWRQRCGGCHLVGGEGTDKPKGPDLAGYLSRPWLLELVNHPEDHRFFGTTKITGMDDYAGRDGVDKTLQLLELVRHHPGVKVADLPPEARPLLAAWSDLSCDNCHELDPGVEGAAPNLNGYGSDSWLAGLIKDGSAPMYYQDQNQMTKLGDKLSEEETDSVIAWLRTYEGLPVARPRVAVQAR